MTQIARAPLPPSLLESLIPQPHGEEDRAAEVLSATAHAWGLDRRTARRPGDVVKERQQYAAPALRDQFLKSLELGNGPLSRVLARSLVDCGNPLPGLVRVELGLPPDSTYSSAARKLLGLQAHVT